VAHDVYLIVAVAGGTLLVIQILLQVFGLGHDGDVDVSSPDDGHGDAFLGVLSLKSVSAFAGVFGLTGLALESAGVSPTLGLVLALLAGLVAMVLVAFLMRGLSRLATTGTLDVQNTVGKTGSVYLRVPARSGGAGKVSLEVQGRSVLLEAMTDGEEIPTGAIVEIVGIIGTETLKVVRAGSRAVRS
jgi:membrane protein implicated in regulation of membrane protease activity